MKTKIFTSSLLALAVATPGFVLAQEEGVIEEIVVTGSLIRGTPEDAALPVEVHTQEDMLLSGAPTALEFAKSLTSSGPTTGEAYYFGGAGLTGNVQYNLRGLGADKTLSLFNGRRINQNTSVIPGIVTQRVEVLKDGAAVTYGADATGGVVNFITRDFYEGIQASASYKAISGSDGDYTMELMGGFGGDDTNIIWAAEWNHRSELDSGERDFSSQPYSVNPAPHSNLTNMAGWVAHEALPATPTTARTQISPFVPGVFSNTGEFGPMVGSTGWLGSAMFFDYSPQDCLDVGGTLNSVSCRYNYAPYYNIVEDNDIYRLFGQINSAVNDSMNFHMRVAFANILTPAAEGSPSQPVIRGTALNEGATDQFYVPVTNPFFADFATRSGLVNDPNFANVAGVSAFTYRAFAHGGNPTFARGNNSSVPSKFDNRYWHLTTGLDGEFSTGITYDLSFTYNNSTTYADSPDLIAYRLQEALNGFGGPNCNTAGLDTDPNRFGTQNAAAAGQGDCMWYNPFASNFASQPILGLSNPQYGGAAFENSPELVRWLFDDRATETVRTDYTVDLIFSGETPLELPGGNIAWGGGVQLRNRQEKEFVDSDIYNGNQPCVWPNVYGQNPLPPSDPNYNGCTPDEPGPFQFFGTNPPDSNRQDQRSAFVEFNLPVLDSLFFGLAGRYEEFSGGLDSTVYKVSGQWQIIDSLSLRGSYGTNYQTPDIDVIPGEVTNGVNSYTIVGGAWLGAQTVTRADIVPETATVWSLGLIWQSEGFTDGSDFRFIIDHFNIETEDELGLLATANDIANSVFEGGIQNCSHPLVGRVTFNSPCSDGDAVTSNTFSNITTEYGNGPGQNTAGFDIQTNYSFPFMEGDLGFGLTATYVTKDENTASLLDGFEVAGADDRLGDLNFATVGFASSKLRANLNTNYAYDVHNFRLGLNFISGVRDERFFDANGNITLAAGDRFGVEGEDWLSADFTYNGDFEWATITATIGNLTDQDPPESRQELGYDPRIGSPLGRTFEIGIRKDF